LQCMVTIVCPDSVIEVVKLRLIREVLAITEPILCLGETLPWKYLLPGHAEFLCPLGGLVGNKTLRQFIEAPLPIE
jgi:hypothetical protein